MKAKVLSSHGGNDTVPGNAYRAVTPDIVRELLERAFLERAVFEILQKLANDPNIGCCNERALQTGQSHREGSSSKLVDITLQIILAETTCMLNIVTGGDHQSRSKSETQFVREGTQHETAKIFISYRHDDSSGYAGRVHDRLQHEFGADLVFMDVDAIPLGVNFVKILREEVARCGVLLAVIGPDWLDVRDDDGNRRLENPNDFVRIEIAAALQRDIPVIPILLNGARIPKADQLPDDLKELASRNGLDVRHASFQSDMERLVRGLKASI